MHQYGRRQILIVLLLPFGLIAGCSENPLSEPKVSPQDHLLLGSWRRAEGDEAKWLTFTEPTAKSAATKLGDPKLLVMAEHTTGLKGGAPYAWKARRVFLASVGTDLYLNAYTEPSKGAVAGGRSGGSFDIPGGFDFFRISVEKDRLELTPLNAEAMLAAIRQGQIAGRITKDAAGEPQIVALTAPSEKLRAFLATKEGRALFPLSGRLVFERAGMQEN